MARKDVDLVIRAKDEAAKVVDTITKALNEFVTAQASLDSRSKKTESSLSQLGDAIAGLDKKLSGLDVGKKLTSEIDAASGAIARLEVEVESTDREIVRLSRDVDRAGQIAARYAAKIAGATAAIERQKAAVAKAKVEQRELSAAYNQSVAAQEKIAARQNKLPALIAAQSAAVAKASQRYSDLSAELLGTVEPSRSFVDSVEAANRSLVSQEKKLADLRGEYGSIDSKLRAAGSAVAIFGQQSAQAATDLARQEGVLTKIAQNYAELGVKSKSAATNQKTFTDSLSKAQTKLGQQSEALNKAEGDFVELAVAAGQADAALEKLSKQSIGNLQGELDRQRRSMLEAKREYLGLSAASSKLATDISKAGVPTRQMSQAFAETKAAAGAAKVEYQTQRETLLRMGQAFKAAGTDIVALEAVQRQFVQLLSQTSAALKKNDTALDQQTSSIRALHSVTETAAASTRRLARESASAASSASSSSQATRGLAQAYRELYGDTRKSLSLTQRLRGEVLSLIAAYGGFYGVVSLLGQVVTAYQTIEAATARLNVANEGDIIKTADDMDFLRRTAQRLGVDLGTLAQEYSKFSVATIGTNLEGAATRKIFLSVAEAARVNRTSNEELSGVFVALTQIVSKGAVQMEELRQQLGDRLPGALQIMADGLKVGTDELIKMLEQGKVTSDALIPFAEELDRRFGPGLGEALAGTTVALGRLGNAAFEALLKFGNAGFIDAFTELANNLTELLQSADFETFINRASAAVSVLIDGLSFLVQNFDLFIAAGTAFIGLKLVPVFILLATAIGRVVPNATAAAASVATFNRITALSGATAATAATRVGLLTGALRLLTSGTGIGLLITGAAAAFGYWAANADLATDALTEHQRILDAVKNAYDQADGSVEAWRVELEGLTATDATRNLRQLEDAIDAANTKLLNAFSDNGDSALASFTGLAIFTGVSRQYSSAVQDIIKQYRDGKISAQDLLTQVEGVNESFRDGSATNARFAEGLIDAIRPIIDLEEAAGTAKEVLTALTGTTEDAEAALEGLAGGAEDTAQALDTATQAGIEAFSKSMTDLIELMPGATSEMGRLAETVAEIDVAFQTALANARALPDAIMRIAAEQAALAAANGAIIAATQQSVDGQFGGFTDGASAAAALIRDREGFRETPYWDVNAFRVGFGSDTVTLSDGTIRQVTEGMSVSVADANRDLLRRIETEFMPIARNASGGRFDSFTAQQQAALTSIAYNYGEIPDRVASVIQAGAGPEAIAAAIRGLGGDNDGVNRARRNEEAALFTSTAGIEGAAAAQVEADEARADAAAEAAEAAAEEREDTAATLADSQFAVEQQELVNAGRERQAEIEAAIREARANDPNITQAEIDALTEQTGRLFDLKKAQDDLLTSKEKAEEAEKAINDLIAQRAALTEQLQFAIEANDSATEDELRGKIAGINTELESAILNAKAMWEAVGGTEADAAIAQLETARLEAENFDKLAEKNYLDWSRVSDLFINGLSSAFDKFSQAVAEGTSVGQAAREAFLQFASDFLLQIAQMIIQQAIFNGLKAAFGGTSFGSVIGLGHTGGIVGSKLVGSGNMTRNVNPAIFSGAMRYHTGGIVGLQPNEVPIIAKKGEAMLTESDPYHPNNRSKLAPAAAGPSGGTKIVNAIDGSSFLDQALATEEGQRVFLNYMRANKEAVRSVIE